MLQSYFAEFLQLYSSIALVCSTYSLVSDLIRCADRAHYLNYKLVGHTINFIKKIYSYQAFSGCLCFSNNYTTFLEKIKIYASPKIKTRHIGSQLINLSKLIYIVEDE